MLIHQNIEFHNVEELHKGEHGLLLYRFPKKVTDTLNPNGKTQSTGPTTGVELRFVPKSEVTIRIWCAEEDATVSRPAELYLGGFQSGWTWLAATGLMPGENVIKIGIPENMAYLEKRSRENGFTWSPWVFRLMLPAGTNEFISAEGDFRAPLPEEKPSKKILFYGSSITHGSLSLLPGMTYVNQVAEELNAEVINKGLAGGCHLERSVSDWIAEQKGFDFAVCELGSNAFHAISNEEFIARVTYLIQTYRAAFPEKSLYLIDNLILEPACEPCREIVRKIVEETDDEKVIYLNGFELLEGRRSVAADFTHPTAMGHVRLTKNLVNAIRLHGDDQ